MSNHGSSLFTRDLTAAHFDALMLRLDTERDRAGEKYEEIRWKLIRFFRWNSCSDAEALADEAFNRAAERLVGEKDNVQNIVAFLWGIARKVRLEALRKDGRTLLLPDLSDPATSLADRLTTCGSQNGTEENDRRLKCLRRSIQRLPVNDRRILLEYYSPGKRRVASRRKLAQEYGLTRVALRVRAARLRSKLEASIRDYLAELEP